MTAYIVGIHIAPDKGKPMLSVGSVRALKGLGLEGDRYALQKGSWIDKISGRHKPKRNVTLISEDGIKGAVRNGIKFEAEETRRNVIVRGLDVNELIGKEFMLGAVRCKGVEYSKPCNRPSKLCGKSGFKAAFHGNGGVNCEILEGGEIATGDEIKILEK